MKKNCNECENTLQNSGICERFLQIRVYFFANSNRKFAKRTGIDERTLSLICNGKRNAGKNVMEKVFASLPTLSKAWLVFGEGEMLSSALVTQTNNGHVGGDMVAGDVVNGSPHTPSKNGTIATLQRTYNEQMYTHTQDNSTATEIALLREIISEKDIRISELKECISDLRSQLSDANSTIKSLTETIARQS